MVRFLPGRRPFGVFWAGWTEGCLSAGTRGVFRGDTSQHETFLQHLRRHEQRQTTYLEMSRGLAESGIEKWTVDTGRMSMTFYDKAGREMLVEQIS